MKSNIRSACFLFLVLSILPISGIGQDIIPNDTSRTNLISLATEIMTEAGTCALITLDNEGRPRVRTMDPFAPEGDLTVWFGTNPRSRKVEQIKNDPRVTIYYLDSLESGYVMIHGAAQIVDDENEKAKRWKEGWEAFYPNIAKDYVLIKVTPKWMEVVSYTHDILGDTLTWEPPAVGFGSR